MRDLPDCTYQHEIERGAGGGHATEGGDRARHRGLRAPQCATPAAGSAARHRRATQRATAGPNPAARTGAGRGRVPARPGRRRARTRRGADPPRPLRPIRPGRGHRPRRLAAHRGLRPRLLPGRAHVAPDPSLRPPPRIVHHVDLDVHPRPRPHGGGLDPAHRSRRQRAGQPARSHDRRPRRGGALVSAHPRLDPLAEPRRLQLRRPGRDGQPAHRPHLHRTRGPALRLVPPPGRPHLALGARTVRPGRHRSREAGRAGHAPRGVGLGVRHAGHRPDRARDGRGGGGPDRRVVSAVGRRWRSPSASSTRS